MSLDRPYPLTTDGTRPDYQREYEGEFTDGEPKEFELMPTFSGEGFLKQVNVPNQRAGGKGASTGKPLNHRLRCIGLLSACA